MSNYITAVEAQIYFDNRLNIDPWEYATPVDRDKSIGMATSIIDRLNYLGIKSDVNQVNQFPRDADSVIPQDIKDATAEIALALLDGVDPELEFENLSMITQNYGNVKSTYDRSINQDYKLAGVPSVTAWRMLKPYLRDQLTIDLNRVS